MMTKMVVQQAAYVLIACVVSGFLISFARMNDPIILKDEPLGIKPEGFYISGLTDERASKALPIQLLTLSAGKLVNTSADLKGGVTTALNSFIAKNLIADKEQRPVVITVKQLGITEKLADDKQRIDGQVALVLSFGLRKDYGTEHLISYQGGLHYKRSIAAPANADLYLRSALKNGIAYFNNWMKTNLQGNIKLAQKVEIDFTDHTEPAEGDTIYYSAKRPLTWADFQSKIVPSGPFTAEVMPSIGYEEQHKVVNGVIKVQVSMKAYLPKSAAWASGSTRDSYSLNHEQRHFDIVKIIAEQYKQKIKAKQLTPDNWEAAIGMQYLDSFRDMYAMQTAYDKETSHGRNRFSQSAWDEKVTSQLKAFGVAKAK